MAAVKRNRQGVAGRATQTSEVGWPEWVDQAATARLRDVIRGERIGHAYLLSGPKGVGKAALARAFAQALCCPDADESDRSRPCGVCRVCRNVQRDTHQDVETFSLESQAMLADKPGRGATLTIDTVRRLRSSAALLPLESDRRILIVDDAEALLEPAQQALLKTLEEPPGGVTILLLADEPEALLATVRSRCHQILVRPIPRLSVENALLSRGIDDGIAAETAMLSRGCAGWALAAASDQKLLRARRAEWESASSWISSSRYEQLVTAFTLGDQYGKRRSEVVGVLQAAIQILRDEMIDAAGNASRVKENGTSLVGAALALELGRAIASSLQCLADLESNVRPKLALEAMVVAWPSSEPRLP